MASKFSAPRVEICSILLTFPRIFRFKSQNSNFKLIPERPLSRRSQRLRQLDMLHFHGIELLAYTAKGQCGNRANMMLFLHRFSAPRGNLDEIPPARSNLLFDLACISSKKRPALTERCFLGLGAGLQFNASKQEHVQFSDVAHKTTSLFLSSATGAGQPALPRDDVFEASVQATGRPAQRLSNKRYSRNGRNALLLSG
jgi:hypothetical protein